MNKDDFDEVKMRLECAAAYLAELGWTEELADKDELVRRAKFEIAKALKRGWTKVKSADETIIKAAEAWADARKEWLVMGDPQGERNDEIIKAYRNAEYALEDAVAERRGAGGSE